MSKVDVDIFSHQREFICFNTHESVQSYFTYTRFTMQRDVFWLLRYARLNNDFSFSLHFKGVTGRTRSLQSLNVRIRFNENIAHYNVCLLWSSRIIYTIYRKTNNISIIPLLSVGKNNNSGKTLLKYDKNKKSLLSFFIILYITMDPRLIFKKMYSTL